MCSAEPRVEFYASGGTMYRQSAGQTRRLVLGLIASGAVLAVTRPRAEPAMAVRVWKDPSCGCCRGWVEHLRRNGFAVAVIDTTDVQAIKAERGVPAALASCHTAEIGRYTV